MRHLKKGRKFHRKKGQRKALLKGLMSNLILKEKIETTEAKAKEIKSAAEKMVTVAKKQNLSALRLLTSLLPKKAAEKLYYSIAPRYQGRKGGYLRVVKKVSRRKNDGSKMAMIEFM